MELNASCTKQQQLQQQHKGLAEIPFCIALQDCTWNLMKRGGGGGGVKIWHNITRAENNHCESKFASGVAFSCYFSGDWTSYSY